MITPEIRQELRQIQSELGKPFPANQHEVRDLPGSSRKWVYLRWQTIRERLDEVCPDWVVDYSEIQYLGNDAICRCGITILGIRKEALASVPISVLSSKGNEMTRGSAADRLAAEALKNAAETWGIGRYLDDQEFTIRYLWERMSELDEHMQGEVRRLSEQYKIQVSGRQSQVKPKNETGFIHAVAGVESSFLITEGQRKRLWAIGKGELKLSDEQIKAAQKSFGFDKTEAITRDKYESLIDHLRSVAASETQTARIKDFEGQSRLGRSRTLNYDVKPAEPTQDLYPANNDIVRQIRSLTKHDPAWIFAICKHYGYQRPGAMPPEMLEKLITDMCADWVVSSGAVKDRLSAHTSIVAAISFARSSGLPLVDAALKWLVRHQSKVSV